MCRNTNHDDRGSRMGVCRGEIQCFGTSMLKELYLVGPHPLIHESAPRHSEMNRKPSQEYSKQYQGWKVVRDFLRVESNSRDSPSSHTEHDINSSGAAIHTSTLRSDLFSPLVSLAVSRRSRPRLSRIASLRVLNTNPPRW